MLSSGRFGDRMKDWCVSTKKGWLKGMDKLRVGINGAAGRMGRRLLALAMADAELDLVAAIEGVGSPFLGATVSALAGEGDSAVQVTDRLPAELDVVVDFSIPAGTENVTRQCRERTLPLVVATTGLEQDQQQLIREASAEIPIVQAPSMSLAVNLTMQLATLAAKTLCQVGADADVEILERHHRFKEDAPSGTALRFGELIAEAAELTTHTHGREGRPGQRPRDEIGYHAIRTGDNPGEHTIVFGMLGETIELSVKASNRDCYALGALAAAKFVVGKAPGIYDMFAVLGLR